MPDPLAKRAPDGPPLKTKAEKRAEAKATKARARTMKKRRQALTIAGAALLVVALLVGLIAWIGNTSSEPAASPSTEAAAPAPEPAPTTPAAAFPPVPAGADPALSTKPEVGAGSGEVTELKSTVLVPGSGPEVQSGQTVEVNYVGVTYADGKEFDSSWSRSEAFSFPVGAGNVIQGWDQGLLGAKVGSRVQLDIPAEQAYGENPGGGRPGGALRFVVDVLSAN